MGSLRSVRVVVRSGPRSGQSVVLWPGQSVVVGRRAPAELLIAEDGLLSGRHLELLCDERGCWLRDLGSTNGTFLAGRRVAAVATLADGDEIDAGDTRLQVSFDRAPASTPAPPGLAPRDGGHARAGAAETSADSRGVTSQAVPHASLPGATPPRVSAPSASGPSVSGPSVSGLNVSAPSVSAPSVSAPSVAAPSVAAPSVPGAAVSAPSVAAPSAVAPGVSAPAFAAPSVSAPGVAVPHVSTQSIASTGVAPLPRAAAPALPAASPSGSTVLAAGLVAGLRAHAADAGRERAGAPAAWRATSAASGVVIVEPCVRPFGATETLAELYTRLSEVAPVHVLVDAANAAADGERLRHVPDAVSLMERVPAELHLYTPLYLPPGPVAVQYIEKLWGKSLIVAILSPLSPDALVTKLRQLLRPRRSGDGVIGLCYPQVMAPYLACAPSDSLAPLLEEGTFVAWWMEAEAGASFRLCVRPESFEQLRKAGLRVEDPVPA
jgi:predicted component of type VI protein secretion system